LEVTNSLKEINMTHDQCNIMAAKVEAFKKLCKRADELQRLITLLKCPDERVIGVRFYKAEKSSLPDEVEEPVKQAILKVLLAELDSIEQQAIMMD
jgi:hypothetical protein